MPIETRIMPYAYCNVCLSPSYVCLNNLQVMLVMSCRSLQLITTCNSLASELHIMTTVLQVMHLTTVLQVMHLTTVHLTNNAHTVVHVAQIAPNNLRG